MPDDYDLVPVDDQPQFADIPTPKTGQIVQPVTVGQDIASMPGKVAGVAGQLTGVSDAARALRGQMTPEEAQTFALGAIPALAAGPEAEIAEEAAPEVANAVTQGIRAFHGSPYDFNQFDLSKIGTGEGAQAYGHGLYFAENPTVAQEYKGRLSTLANVNQSPEANTALYYLQQNGFDKGAARASLENDLRTKLPDTHNVVEAINAYDPGKMYEVNINADPEHFLDWDKPLSEQPETLRNALPGMIQQYGGDLQKLVSANGDLRPAVPGQSVYQALSKAIAGNENFARNPPQAADVLRNAGIPGIKYLDQGSRGTGQGTSNYVVFNDKLIDIVKKYGLAGVIAGGASHFQTTPVDYNPFPEDQSKMASGGRLVAAEPNIISSHAYNKRAA